MQRLIPTILLLLGVDRVERWDQHRAWALYSWGVPNWTDSEWWREKVNAFRLIGILCLHWRNKPNYLMKFLILETSTCSSEIIGNWTWFLGFFIWIWDGKQVFHMLRHWVQKDDIVLDTSCCVLELLPQTAHFYRLSLGVFWVNHAGTASWNYASVYNSSYVLHPQPPTTRRESCVKSSRAITTCQLNLDQRSGSQKCPHNRT